MILKVDASFENGVFVPANRPALADRERVRLTIEAAANTRGESQRFGDRDDSVDLGSRTSHNLAIALDFHPDGC